MKQSMVLTTAALWILLSDTDLTDVDQTLHVWDYEEQSMHGNLLNYEVKDYQISGLTSMHFYGLNSKIKVTAKFLLFYDT